MALPEFSLRQLLEAGVHFGHQTQRWDPLMEPYIYGSRNGIHILDLTQTVPMLDQALNIVRETVAKGGSILFVGTKRQASSPIAEAAEKCAQYYMNTMGALDRTDRASDLAFPVEQGDPQSTARSTIRARWAHLIASIERQTWRIQPSTHIHKVLRAILYEYDGRT